MTLWTRAKAHKSFDTKTCIEQGAGWLSVSPQLWGQMGTLWHNSDEPVIQNKSVEKPYELWIYVIRSSWLTFLEDITQNKQTSQIGLGKQFLQNDRCDRRKATDILVSGLYGGAVLSCVKNSVVNVWGNWLGGWYTTLGGEKVFTDNNNFSETCIPHKLWHVLKCCHKARQANYICGWNLYQSDHHKSWRIWNDHTLQFLPAIHTHNDFYVQKCPNIFRGTVNLFTVTSTHITYTYTNTKKMI